MGAEEKNEKRDSHLKPAPWAERAEYGATALEPGASGQGQGLGSVTQVGPARVGSGRRFGLDSSGEGSHWDVSGRRVL